MYICMFRVTFFLLFSYETYLKCGENYSDSFGRISKNIPSREVNI